MPRALAPLNVVATALGGTAVGWLVLVAVGNGALQDMMVLHRDAPSQLDHQTGPAPLPSRQAKPAPVQRENMASAADPYALVIPVGGVRPEQLTDTFSQARANGARRHDAIDIMAPLGTPVLAAAPGKVEKVFLSRDGGNTIYVRSQDRRTIYYYAHLDSYAPDLREGRMVGAGELLGRVGYSGNGNPSAPHLHFAIWKVRPEIPWYGQGEAVNPYPLLSRD